MANRKFKLPDYEELTKDQDKVLRLPKDGQFLIVGGPGTGKSVVALLHTMRYQQGNDHLFLTYNHVLKEFTKQCVESNINNDTAYSWFYRTYYTLTKQFVPVVEARKPDYDRIIQIYDKINLNESEAMYFVIDEGQDLPQGFYQSIMALGHENFFIVADQNQQITDERSSIHELADMLDLDRPDVIELKENFRNTTPIAIFSQYFYTDKASPKPALPDKPSLDAPILYEYELVDNCVKLILREADRDPSKLIGVIVATVKTRDDYERSLKEMDIERDYEKPLVSIYKSSSKGKVEIDFSQGGIVVITDKSSKGVEFDIVFIVLDGLKLYQEDVTGMKKRLYVMTSRAKEKLILFKGRSCEQAVSDLMPEDETILTRDTL